MDKIVLRVVAMTLLAISGVWANSSLSDIITIAKGSTLTELQQFAMRAKWRPILRESHDLWSSREAIAFQSIRSKVGSKNIALVVYSVDFFGTKHDVFFFFYQDKLFAVNFFIEDLNDAEFVRLVQEIGGSKENGYLGYGKPIEVESPYIAYMWYLTASLDQTLIMTYLNQNVTPIVNIQIVHEKLLPAS
ncbi:hypothetical protein PVA45_03480 [Entomospira entomophila]|uniref:Uncharacterized protein n=1 Tax=Entomospira entomophila TaxID=2719988 RepID=A0A968KRB7_9SPIO|nr:hypothetical protein [Entomospira entomophilus]NIZ40573.1 hypothetical protein [Entomospira entomophilus]WDI36131.1 hypothetical protein PVA45_03480 [Entomospira entomophilus]